MSGFAAFSFDDGRNHRPLLSVFGASLARALLHQGLIGETQDGYPVLSLNAQSGQVLRQVRNQVRS